MNQIKFGRLEAPAFKVRAAHLPAYAEADKRFTTWALTGLLIGFLAAAIECL